ncbi:MAG: hydroxyethylthiazole kinase [Veillonella caviae]|nr:hydroxyethylthiazole kinase [Veillonella caviae]
MRVKDMSHYVEKLRQKNPLVICLTNDVVKNFTANGLLALGASPVMSGCKEDLQDLMPLANAVLINIGTITPELATLYKAAAKLANAHNVPIILDPVAAGAGAFRKSVALDLLTDYKIAVIRGNAGEIAALVNESIATKGVDSSGANEPGPLAQRAAKQYKTVVIATGAVDGVATESGYVELANGSSLMPKVVGTGCLLGAVVAAFVGSGSNQADVVIDKGGHQSNLSIPCHDASDAVYFDLARAAISTYNVSGELAELKSFGKGPGTYAVEFINALEAVTDDMVIKQTQCVRTAFNRLYNDRERICKAMDIYFICGTQDFEGHEDQALKTIEEALQAGITMFQLREKGKGSLEGARKKDFALKVQALCKQYKVPFIVNDDMDLAEELDADGVHIGQDDAPIEEVRVRFGHKIIGLSIHDVSEYKLSNVALADYIGVGPIHGTQSKADAKSAIGYEGIQAVRHFDPQVPIVAIGGIVAADVKPLKTAGADGVSVISAITKASDVSQAVAALKQ